MVNPNTEPSTSTVQNAENIKQIKKRRRPRVRSRNKQNSIESIKHTSIPEFKIRAVKHPRALVFRHRNTKFEYINIDSFIKVRVPYIFITKLDDVSSTTNDFSCLTISTNKYKHNRKFEHKLKIKTRTSGKRQNKEKEDVNFPEYLTIEQVEEGLANRSLVKGFIRINPKNFKEAYINNLDRNKPDYVLTKLVDRNRALEGDEVVLEINSKRIVYILKQRHERTTIGFITPPKSKDKRYATLISRDKRFPRLRIPAIFLPTNYEKNPESYENILFVAKLTKWDNVNYANGCILETLGKSGDLKVETKAILREFHLETKPFSEKMKPKLKDLSPQDFKNREDIRKDCVFTIDPATARDLDDAVSCKQLPNGNLEIGVHISDVTHYLSEGTPLDKLVQKKATTIYLVDNVYHMLPEELCLFCSLLPGTDKLAFSVFWEFTKNAEIINKRLVKTVLNSCAKLAYEHAQLMIDNVNKDFDKELPEIYNNFTAKDLHWTVNNLQSIAVKLREKRIKNGALRIDQIKLNFSLDPVSGLPTDYFRYENLAAHRLIEEFMLLANITVAEFINEKYPELAFLRRHEPPKQNMLNELERILQSIGIHMDISSSGGIQASLLKYDDSDFLGKCRMAVLNHLFAKPMIRAEYFCAGYIMTYATGTHHYALSVPIYTHFTSPIRRYADIVVHRLLSAALGYIEKGDWNSYDLAVIAENCNIQKHNAKRAGEASSDLYLAHLIEDNQPYIEKAVIVDVRERSTDAIVLSTGSVIRLHYHEFDDNIKFNLEKMEDGLPKSADNNEKRICRLVVTFNGDADEADITIVLEMFSVVKVQLSRIEKTNKLKAKLLKPVPTFNFQKQIDS